MFQVISKVLASTLRLREEESVYAMIATSNPNADVSRTTKGKHRRNLLQSTVVDLLKFIYQNWKNLNEVIRY